ncbi:MAG: hypothetical protein NZ552_04425 [Planctomycetes bacterium]|nr:hypothetical protein [Planctomycetota bacterium]
MPDDGPLTSYSDPFYDRLDAMAQAVRRQWWLFALVIVCIVLAAIALRLWWHREPTALGGVVAARAAEEQDEAKSEALWTELADGERYDPGFRAAAAIELCQRHLLRGETTAARRRAEDAERWARAAEDDDLILAAGLSRAAALLDGGDATAAFDLYDAAARGAGARFPARRLVADIGAALALDRLGRREEALARLEPLTGRSERGAENLLQLAASMYWHYKRGDAPLKPSGLIEATAVTVPADAVKPKAPAAPAEGAPAPPAAPAPTQ